MAIASVTANVEKASNWANVDQARTCIVSEPAKVERVSRLQLGRLDKDDQELS